MTSEQIENLITERDAARRCCDQLREDLSREIKTRKELELRFDKLTSINKTIVEIYNLLIKG